MRTTPRARRERLLVRPLADEVLVYDLDNYTAVCLNRAAAAVWRRCDGTTDLEAIAQAVAVEIDAPFDVDAVWCALDSLEKRGLVDPLGEGVHRPRRTRREWLRQLGQAGLAGALVPAVLAVVAPSAAEAASTISWEACEAMKGMCGGERCITKAGKLGFCVFTKGGSGFCVCS